MGFKVSFSGNITFKNAQPLRILVGKLNINDLLIETDSPFLAPVPLRGKINSPLFLGYVCLEIARIKNCSVNDVAFAVYNSFKDLFIAALNFIYNYLFVWFIISFKFNHFYCL